MTRFDALLPHTLGSLRLALCGVALASGPASAQEPVSIEFDEGGESVTQPNFTLELPGRAAEELDERGSFPLAVIREDGLVLRAQGSREVPVVRPQTLVISTLVFVDGEFLGGTGSSRIDYGGSERMAVPVTRSGEWGIWDEEELREIDVRHVSRGPALPVETMMAQAQSQQARLLLEAAEKTDVGDTFIVFVALPTDGEDTDVTTSPLFHTPDIIGDP